MKDICHTIFQELFGFWSVVALLLVVITIYTCRSYFRAVLLSLRLSGPPSLPLLGNCLLIKERNLLRNRFATAYGLYGSVVRVWVLLFPFFAVLQPEDLQVVLSSKEHTDKVFFYRLLHNFLGDGLITSSGRKWSHHRRLLQPAFHLSILEQFIATFADASRAMLAILDVSQDGEVNIAKYVNDCVIDILNEAVLGVPVQDKRSGGVVDMQQSPFRQGKVVVPQRFVQPWLLLESIYRMTQLAADEIQQQKRLNDFTRQMIARRRALHANAGANAMTERKCLLDYLIEMAQQNVDFTDDDIVSEACTLMLAGQDSVGAAVAFTIFLLAQNSDAQKRCHDEIDRIFANDTRAPTSTDLREMHYLEMCIKEALRLYPSVPLVARKLGEDARLRNYTLPAGSNVFISPYATHRLPHIYPDPEKFDPERFAPQVANKRHPYAFIPFSAGPRYCIGKRFALMEMKTIVSHLLRSYAILPVAGKTSFETIFRITLRASGGLWVRLQPRYPGHS